MRNLFKISFACLLNATNVMFPGAVESAKINFFYKKTSLKFGGKLRTSLRLRMHFCAKFTSFPLTYGHEMSSPC